MRFMFFKYLDERCRISIHVGRITYWGEKLSEGLIQLLDENSIAKIVELIVHFLLSNKNGYLCHIN
jgi:hypothetical protein